MTNTSGREPPRIADLFLRLLLPSGVKGESIVGDLHEEYWEYLDGVGRVRDSLWYWHRVYVIGRRYVWPQSLQKRPFPSSHRPSVWSGLLRSAAMLSHDLHFGIRTLRKRSAFTLISILTLGTGIGGTAAIFSVVDGVLIRDLPFRDPDRLVSIWKAWPSWQGVEGLDYTWDHIHFPWADYQNVANHATSFSEVATFMNDDVVLTGDREPELLSMGRASLNLFGMLGVRPYLGRVFVDEEVPPVGPQKGANVVILSHELWKRRFGEDRGLIGQTIVLRGSPYEVIGILPPGFRIPSDLIRTHENGGDVDAGLRDVWIPLRRYTNDSNSYELLARLAPGVGIEQARTEVQTLMTIGPDDQLARVESRKVVLTKGFGTPLLVLFCGAGVLLLVACVNVAGLLVGEATGRYHEVAVRHALGAGRGRIVRQLLTENVLLGLLGTVLGLLLAWLGKEALLSVAPPLPRLEEVTLSGRVLAVAVTAGVGTGLLFGLAPALTLAGRHAGDSLRSRGQSAGRSGRSLQGAIVSVQVALTIVLLVAGGLFGRSLLRLLAVDPGFDADGLAVFAVSMPEGNAADEDQSMRSRSWESLFAEIVRSVQGVSGVRAATGVNHAPFNGGTGTNSVQLEQGGETVWAAHYVRRVSHDYHEVMGIPLRSGRLFTPADGPESPRVMLINESLAQLYWPDRSPLGEIGRKDGEVVEVVGVVGDVKKQALSVSAEPTFYFPATQHLFRLDQQLVVRTMGDPGALLPTIRAAIRDVDASILIGEPNTLNALKSDSEADDRFRTILMLTFACVATLLAAVGVFGVTARGVAARTREMGIRMALGARRTGLIRLALSDSIRSAMIGTAIGLVGAFWATNLFEHFLFGVENLDPATYAGVSAFLMLVCLGAAFVPAKRVTKISPREIIAEE